MKPLDREILRLAVPAIVSNITTPLLGLMDTAITGHMGGAVYIAAVSVGATMFNLLYWTMGFLRMSTSGLTAQAFGSGSDSSPLLSRALAVALAISLLIILFRDDVGSGLLSLLDVDSATRPLAEEYFAILAWGAPASLSTFAMTGWLLGLQDSKAGLWVSLTVNVTNVAATLVAVFILHLGVAGVASGTLLAQWVGAAVAFFLCRRKGYSVSWPGSGGGNLQSIRLDLLIALRTLCLVGVTLWFTRCGASQGVLVLAANALLIQFFTLFSYFLDGFAFAGEALAGKFAGAGSTGEGRRCVVALMRWGLMLAILFSALYLLLGEEILSLLSDDGGVVESATVYLPWVALVPLVGFGAFVWDGVFIGQTRAAGMLAATAVGALLFFILASVLLPRYGNHGLWAAFCSWLACRAGVQTLIWARRKNK